MMKRQHILEIGGRIAFAGLLSSDLLLAIELNADPDQHYKTNRQVPSIVEGPLEGSYAGAVILAMRRCTTKPA